MPERVGLNHARRRCDTHIGRIAEIDDHFRDGCRCHGEDRFGVAEAGERRSQTIGAGKKLPEEHGVAQIDQLRVAQEFGVVRGFELEVRRRRDTRR